MRTGLFTIWMLIVVLMAAGCTGASPAQEMGGGTPDDIAKETPTTSDSLAEETPPSAPSAKEPRTGTPLGGAPAVPAEAQALVDLAREDLALETKAEDITLLSVEEFDFRDTSLGVPEPGKMYAQVITPGYIIRFGIADQVYTYHGSGNRVVRVPDDKS